MSVAPGKILIVCGAHRRYIHVARRLLETFPHAGVILKDRSSRAYLKEGTAVSGEQARLKAFFLEHLAERDRVERRYYPDDTLPSLSAGRLLRVPEGAMHTPGTVRFIEAYGPSVVFSFGVGMFRGEILTHLRMRHTVNLHLGLAPYYRSSDTLLWPLYHGRPDHVGITLHELDMFADHGPIYYQQRTVFDPSDSIHDLFCKTVLQAVDPLRRLLALLAAGKTVPVYRPSSPGTLFRRGAFMPEHLRVIYDRLAQGMLKAPPADTGDIVLYDCFKEMMP